MELLVLHVPGLSARLLRDHADAASGIARVGGEGSAATLVPVAGASPRQLEAALITGLLPEYLGALAGGVGEPRVAPFWVKAARRRRFKTSVQLGIDLPAAWRPTDAQPDLDWRTLPFIAEQGPTRSALRSAERAAAPLLEAAHSVVVVSAWSFALDGRMAPQECAPLDQPVLLVRGIAQPRASLGILEVAGILERALTGEMLHDRI